MDKVRETAIRIMSLMVVMAIAIPIVVVSLVQLANHAIGTIIT